jgi:hypothetical protein
VRNGRLRQRREQLRQLYGFDFPDDLFRFWEFASRLRPLAPLDAFEDTLELHLVGPFEVLASRFDGRTPRYSPVLHWRYYYDPPEFFTVLSGSTDGLHWGYFLDDPATGAGCVASYYARDAYEFSVDGDDLFEAVRLCLEEHYRDCEEYRDEDPDDADGYEDVMRRLDALRTELRRRATGDRPETGEEYVEKYLGRASRNDRITAETCEQMGIVVPPERYRPLSLKDRKLWPHLRKKADPADVVEEARQALRDGFPGTALKLGKDLWPLDGAKKTAYAYELLEAAYRALGRDLLAEVLLTHRANRDLPSVDVLQPDEPASGGASAP